MSNILSALMTIRVIKVTTRERRFGRENSAAKRNTSFCEAGSSASVVMAALV
jgi:hypothetical protein